MVLIRCGTALKPLGPKGERPGPLVPFRGIDYRYKLEMIDGAF